jgi:acyl carrier protein
VKYEAVVHDPLHAMLTHLVIDTLGLDSAQARELTPQTPLFGGSLGLNDLDVLEVAARAEEQFDVSLSEGVGSKDALANIASLASFIRRQAPVTVVANLPALDVEFDEDEVLVHDWFRV